MNRRNLLQSLAAMSAIALFEGCRKSVRVNPNPFDMYPTLQVLIEGPFALVLKGGRLLAFVPRHPKHQHQLFFNDPLNPQKQSDRGYAFELQGNGLTPYDKPYINCDFKDFEASTSEVNLPNTLVKLDLPVPKAIHFSGPPLRVEFANKNESCGPRTTPSFMPTNYILEYQIEREEAVNLKCGELKGGCQFSPHSRTNTRTLFFGVAPVYTPQQKCDPVFRMQHAIEVFNFMLKSSFPRLEDCYKLAKVELASRPCDVTPKMSDAAWSGQAKAVPAVLRDTLPGLRLREVAGTVDCQIGGIIVHCCR